MKRRAVSESRRSLLAAALVPLVAGRAFAQSRERPKSIGYLSGGQSAEWLSKLLAERGFVEGRNLRVDTRIPSDWEEATLRRAAEELVALKPDALYAHLANRVGALAAATRTIPIVTGGVPDPVGAGFAKTLRRPGGNITGLSFGLPETAEITVSIFRMLRPGLKRLGGFFARGTPPAQMAPWMIDAARRSGLEWAPMAVEPGQDVEGVLARFAGEAALVGPTRDPAFGEQIIRHATRLRIMTSGQVEAGALMNYGLEHEDGQNRIAAIMERVLGGANPAEIPFELPSRPDFRLNLATARAMGIVVPPEVMLRVTKVID